ncbi:hypothetical protein J5500_00175 [Candidatus Saccharibacteria bacterium]|nr:hypothetical protein [Candidatus Saccharibacteria bacterium]
MDNTNNFDKDFLQGVQNQVAADNIAQREKDNRKKGLIIGAVIGFVILAVFVALFILITSGSGGEV